MALVLVMLAVTASGADDVGAAARVLTREGEGRKAQWAPTRNFLRLNTRFVFGGESERRTSPYAGEGPETAAGRFVFAWDVDGRLVSATTPQVGNNPGIQAEYEYDGLGLRRQATVTETPLAPAPPITTVRTWTWGGADGEEEVAEDSNLTTHVAGFRVGDGLNAFTHDGLGSVVTQTAGGTTTTAQFSNWGTRTPLGPPLASSSGYTGHRVELTLGLTYAQQRWLDTKTGTFLSRDPVGASSRLMNPNGLYAFGYAAGNPTRFTDPDGRDFGPMPQLPTQCEAQHPGQPELCPPRPDRPKFKGPCDDDPTSASCQVDRFMTGVVKGGAVVAACSLAPEVCVALGVGGTLISGSPVGNGFVDSVDSCTGERLKNGDCAETLGMVAGSAGAGRVLRGPSRVGLPAAARTTRITSGSQVTEQVIRDAMRGAPLQSQQPGGVSLRLVREYVDRLLAGEVAPAIKVDGQIIVDGNHRYIAARILGQEPAIQPWGGGRGPAVPWDRIMISTEW